MKNNSNNNKARSPNRSDGHNSSSEETLLNGSSVLEDGSHSQAQLLESNVQSLESLRKQADINSNDQTEAIFGQFSEERSSLNIGPKSDTFSSAKSSMSSIKIPSNTSTDLFCALCRKLMVTSNHPVLMQCGHSFCWTCVKLMPVFGASNHNSQIASSIKKDGVTVASFVDDNLNSENLNQMNDDIASMNFGKIGFSRSGKSLVSGIKKESLTNLFQRFIGKKLGYESSENIIGIGATLSAPNSPMKHRNQSNQSSSHKREKSLDAFGMCLERPRILSAHYNNSDNLSASSGRHSLDLHSNLSAISAESVYVKCLICAENTKLNQFPDVYGSLEFNDFLASSADKLAHQMSFCSECSNAKASRFCKQCDMYLCGPCCSRIHSGNATSKHKLIDMEGFNQDGNSSGDVLSSAIASSVISAATVECPSHSEEEAVLYCFDCASLTCIICAYGSHKGHNMCLLSDASVQMKRDIEQKTNSFDKEITRLDQLVGELYLESRRILENSVAAKAFVSKRVSDLITSIKETESKMISEIDGEELEKTQKIGKQIACLMSTVEDMKLRHRISCDLSKCDSPLDVVKRIPNQMSILDGILKNLPSSSKCTSSKIQVGFDKLSMQLLDLSKRLSAERFPRERSRHSAGFLDSFPEFGLQSTPILSEKCRRKRSLGNYDDINDEILSNNRCKHANIGKTASDTSLAKQRATKIPRSRQLKKSDKTPSKSSHKKNSTVSSAKSSSTSLDNRPSGKNDEPTLSNDSFIVDLTDEISANKSNQSSKILSKNSEASEKDKNTINKENINSSRHQANPVSNTKELPKKPNSVSPNEDNSESQDSEFEDLPDINSIINSKKATVSRISRGKSKPKTSVKRT